jgi:hemoglobin
MRDIETLDDIRKLVDEFYGKVRADALLGPVFEERIGDRWDTHLDKMYRFWQTVLLDEGQSYFGNPFMKHAPLPISEPHFQRWLELWKGILDSNFEGPKAREAYLRADKMAYVFIVKLDAIRKEGGKPVF